MKIPVRTLKRIYISQCFRPAALALLLLSGLAAISGCGSSSPVSNIQVGPVTFTDVNGTPLKYPPVSLTPGEYAYVDVTLTNDPQLLGANWSVYCGSALPPGTPPPPGQTEDESCGTFTPAHTMSGPIPPYVTSGAGYVAFYTAPAAAPKQGTVTLYASSTSNPSKFSSVTLTIGGLPILVSFASAPPSTMQFGASAQFAAVLKNDDTDAGVYWTATCEASDCGSFNPAQTKGGVDTAYTAPAAAPTGGTVQVTAISVADSTKTVSATIQIY
jgi:hypothetical protein